MTLGGEQLSFKSRVRPSRARASSQSFKSYAIGGRDEPVRWQDVFISVSRHDRGFVRRVESRRRFRELAEDGGI